MRARVSVRKANRKTVEKFVGFTAEGSDPPPGKWPLFSAGSFVRNAKVFFLLRSDEKVKEEREREEQEAVSPLQWRVCV